MRKVLLTVIVALTTSMNVLAQKIQTVDSDGNAIPLVSVFTENGVLIGATDLNGVLADVKGAPKVSLTHVAYKPQLVTVSQLQGGRIVMEDVDFNLEEVVVKPKPYFYMEYYFRGFSYIGDSLRAYAAGILPVAFEIGKNFKSKTRNIYSYGGAANKALAWNVQGLELTAEKGAKGTPVPIETLVRKGKKFNEYYKTTIEEDGETRWIVKNPEGVVGHFLHDDGLYRATLDGSKMQIYANKVNGEEKEQKLRESKNYNYQYSEVYSLDEEGEVRANNKIMELSHWENDTSKGRSITIIYLYVADRGYMDEDEFKARSKELNKGWVGDMPFEKLDEYERANDIPALAPSQLKTIQELTKQTGKNK